MVLMETEKERVRTLMVEAITVLCQNGLNYEKEFSVEGLIGITLDKKDVFLISINQAFDVTGVKKEVGGASSQQNTGKTQKKSKRRKRRLSANKRASSDRSDDEDGSLSASDDDSLQDTSRLSGGEPAEKRRAGSSVASDLDTTNIKQEILEQDSDDDLIFMQEEPGGVGDNQYQEYSANTSLPNLSGPHSGPFASPGCSTWDNSQMNFDPSSSAQSLQTDPTQHSSPGNPNVLPGSRPTCNICGREMASHSDIVKHMRIHTGEKPYNCPQCGFRFNQKSNLYRHMRKKHSHLHV